MTSDAASHLPPVLRPEHSPLRALRELADRFAIDTVGDLDAVSFSGITLATADLRPGEVFVAMQGVNRHGAEFASTAVSRGSVAVVTDVAGRDVAAAAGVPVIVVDNPRAVLGAMSAWVYGTEMDRPLLLATTGTNGKTSVSHLLEGLLRGLGRTTGLSSTAERHIAGEVIVSRLTTPEASEFHALLALMKERGVDSVVVEVSAQALSRHRVDGIVFDVAGFTNLSHDHLEDYGDMQTYLEAKLALFRPGRSCRAVVCLDSPAGSEVLARSEVPAVSILTPAIAADPNQNADWVVTILEERPEGTVFRLEGPEAKSLTTTVPVIGSHMAANAGLALVMLCEAGIPWSQIAALVDGRAIDGNLPGRTQRVSGDRGPTVYVDFGHTPDAFAKTLAAVRRVTPGRIIMMFGASGDRDKTKRFDMGRIAAELSDVVIVTDHHPHTEDPAAIRAALLEGARAVQPAVDIREISPPEDAIVAAVAEAHEGDAILWAGPGHQDHREIGHERQPFSARELARRALIEAGWAAPAATWPSPYAD